MRVFEFNSLDGIEKLVEYVVNNGVLSLEQIEYGVELFKQNEAQNELFKKHGCCVSGVGSLVWVIYYKHQDGVACELISARSMRDYLDRGLILTIARLKTHEGEVSYRAEVENEEF